MAFAKRILLFLAVNFLVVITISLVLNLLGVQPYLSEHGLNVEALMIFCLVWGMGGAFISLSLSRMMAKWLMGVHVLDPNTNDPEMQRLIGMVHALAHQARLPAMPEVGIYDSAEPNAFATGPSKRKALVAVSSGLLRRMSPKEVEGVLAHEISHVANGDMVTMTLIQGIVNAFVMFLSRVLAYALSGLGKKQEGTSSGSYMSYSLFVFLFEIVFMLLGSIVVASFSRWREFHADAGGAELAGREKMISALVALQKLQEIRDPHTDKPSFQALKISTGKKKSTFLMLFATHPPLEKRIARLRGEI